MFSYHGNNFKICVSPELFSFLLKNDNSFFKNSLPSKPQIVCITHNLSNMHQNVIFTSYPLLPCQLDNRATNKWWLVFLLIKVYQTVKYEENL